MMGGGVQMEKTFEYFRLPAFRRTLASPFFM
jgi:hypothetical protein